MFFWWSGRTLTCNLTFILTFIFEPLSDQGSDFREQKCPVEQFYWNGCKNKYLRKFSVNANRVLFFRYQDIKQETANNEGLETYITQVRLKFNHNILLLQFHNIMNLHGKLMKRKPDSMIMFIYYKSTSVIIEGFMLFIYYSCAYEDIIKRILILKSHHIRIN